MRLPPSSQHLPWFIRVGNFSNIISNFIISTKQRDTTIDGLKFLMICLVTTGHAIEPTRNISEKSCLIYSVIYSFHMPLFVLLSGFFSKK